jgi:endonuclease YncB( thermonuclease family)
MIMMKRAIETAFLYLFPLLLLILLWPARVAAVADPVPDDIDAYIESLGLDRNFHKCISVADGDTLTLEGLGTVRLVGVDTPEKNHPKLPVQFLSQEAGEFTKKLCLGKRIRLEYDFNDRDLRGNYGRLLGFAYLEDGTFLQEALIKNGYSIAYTKYPFADDRKKNFLTWERQARQMGVGLWRENGLAEINWILARNHPLLLVCPSPEGTWEISFGNWKSGKISSGALERQLDRLYASIYELSPRDLLPRLSDLQYRQMSEADPDAEHIYIVGMTHRKWGIVYRDHARARVAPGQLDRELAMLREWIRRSNKEDFLSVLAQNRYRSLERQPPDLQAHRESVRKFLQVEVAESENGDVIPWDLAGRYVGERKTVEGRILRTHNSGKACFFNFHNNWTRYFSLVIFANVFHRFEDQPESYYLNKRIRVSGKIKLYQGRPEMVVNHPNQIQIMRMPR